MATKTKRKPQAKPEPEVPKVGGPMAPEQVRELLRVGQVFKKAGPAPPDREGFITFFDPGSSINLLHDRHREFFYPVRWIDKHYFATRTDQPRWKQIKLAGSEPFQSFDQQTKGLGKKVEVVHARELVIYLLFHRLATGEHLDILRIRTDDVVGDRRVLVGPFDAGIGMSFATVNDGYKSQNITVATVIREELPEEEE